MRWFPCKWRRVFLPFKALDSAMAWSEMHWLNQRMHTRPTTSGAPLNRNQSRKAVIFSLSLFLSLNFTLRYPPLCIRAARDILSVMRHYLWAEMCGRSSHPHIQCSHKHLQRRNTHTMRWTISGTYSRHKHFVYWFCSLKLPFSCPV